MRSTDFTPIPGAGTAEPPRITITIGEVRVSREPVVLDTVLGSCISACLFDPVSNIGGMNHFMLPQGSDPDNPTSARFGVNAMELLVADLMKMGANRRRLQAKVFGGGHVLGIRESLDGVPQINIRFIQHFLSAEQIPVVSEDLGGYRARRVRFNTHTAKVLVKHLGQNDADRTAQEEMVYLISLKRRKLDGDVTLF